VVRWRTLAIRNEAWIFIRRGELRNNLREDGSPWSQYRHGGVQIDLAQVMILLIEWGHLGEIRARKAETRVHF
jgi:hypothetical protein